VRFFGHLLVVLLACALIGLTPLAYADPPDPLWITGYWDDDDFDNVVVVILGTCIIPVEPPASPKPHWALLAKVESSGRAAIPIPLRSVVRPRAPPVVLLAAS
jgi:hypothetical protein